MSRKLKPIERLTDYCRLNRDNQLAILAFVIYGLSLPLQPLSESRVDKGFLNWEKMVMLAIENTSYNQTGTSASFELEWERLRELVDQFQWFGGQYDEIRSDWLATVEEHSSFLTEITGRVLEKIGTPGGMHRLDRLLERCYLAYLTQLVRSSEGEATDIILGEEDVTKIALLVRLHYHGTVDGVSKQMAREPEAFIKFRIPRNGMPPVSRWPNRRLDYRKSAGWSNPYLPSLSDLGMGRWRDFVVPNLENCLAAFGPLDRLTQDVLAFWVVSGNRYQLCIPQFLQRFISQQTSSMDLPTLPAWAGGEQVFYTVTVELDNPTEKDIQNHIQAKPDLIEEGLSISGSEIPTRSGRIDLIGRGVDGALVVVEIKKGQASHGAVSQIQGYISSVKDTLVDNEPVRGIIVSSGFPEKFEDTLNGSKFKIKAVVIKIIPPGSKI